MSKNVTKNQLIVELDILNGRLVGLQKELQAEQEKNARLMAQLDAALSAASPTDTEMPDPDQALDRLIGVLKVSAVDPLWGELHLVEDGEGLWRLSFPREFYVQAKGACTGFLAKVQARAHQRALGARFERDHLIIWVRK